MKNPPIQKCDTGSGHSETGQIGIKNSLKIIATGVLLLAATSAMAGLLSSPMGVVHTNLELATVGIQDIGDHTVQIRTDGLAGELLLDAGDVPPEFDPPASGCKRFPFDQYLELVINLSLGVVEGHTRGRIATENGPLEFRADVLGRATCLPAGGSDCGQVIVDLETHGALAGALADLSTNNLVGLIHMETLGSLLYRPDSAQWTNLTSNARLGGDAGLFSSIISSTEGESCGV